MKYDTVVIGAGASGMTSACLLARYGHKVALVEKDTALGPVLRGYRKKGVFFDTGFHYAGSLQEGEIVRRFVDFLGLSKDLSFYPFSRKRFDILRFPDGDFDFPYGWDDLIEHFSRQFPSEKAAVIKYFSDVQTVYREIPKWILSPPDLGLFQNSELIHISLKEYLQELTSCSHLRHALALHCILYGIPADECSFMQHAQTMGTYYQSVSGVVGGGRSIVNAYSRELKRLDVDIFTGNGVARLKSDSDGSIQSVILASDEELECIQCISTCHPSALFCFLQNEPVSRVFKRRLSRLEDSMSAVLLYYSCRDYPYSNPMSNVIVSSGEGMNICTCSIENESTPFFISACSPVNNTGSDVGICCIFPVASSAFETWSSSGFEERPVEYTSFKDGILDKLEKRFLTACPEFSGRVERLAGATPLTMKHYFNTPSGCLYGVKRRIDSYQLFARTRITNLFLSGQGIIAPGFAGAVFSAFNTVGSIIGYENFEPLIKE